MLVITIKFEASVGFLIHLEAELQLLLVQSFPFASVAGCRVTKLDFIGFFFAI